MDAVFSRIQEAGLKLKPSKCEFGTTEVNYLAFQVSDKGLGLSARKIEILLGAEPSRLTKVLHSFMCSINYYWTLIPCYARLSAGLLTLSTGKVNWSYGQIK